MFQRIRDEKPEVLKKVVAFQGDVTFDGKVSLLMLVLLKSFVNTY